MIQNGVFQDFIKKIKDFVAFEFLNNNDNYEMLKIKNLKKRILNNGHKIILTPSKWRYFKIDNLFNKIKRGKEIISNLEVNSDESKIPLINST
ncbi:hypothetical protein [Vaccinium witches'-broom phytoplasma]|uniref:hypothetical protein n=1 Tax=Vaccinium witches'-broom phytoplasma TaxID=85642 RepID=UPI000367F5CB|nr:hypothetical protein [Vaccinium witches'-broom phytoplasma]